MKKKFLLIALSLSFLGPTSGEGIDGRSLLLRGKDAMDAGRYPEAIESLSAAHEKVPVMGDYILFWLSKAYQEAADINESNNKIQELLAGYPDSPLRKKARSMEIKNIIASNEIPPGLKVFEAYIKDYPEDYDIKFLFGQALKSQGKAERAKTIFRDIYVNSPGISSKAAHNELAPSDITAYDLIEKASNLINAMEFAEAEAVLRAALLKDDGQRKLEILKKLGHSVFKQKRYKESAEIYEKAGDNYWRAMALYRAGDKAAFGLTLKKLALTGDKRTGSLLLLAASDKRRNNEIDEALGMYKTLKANYPSEAENSMWGIGWTYYLSNDYQKALDAFTELCSAYGSPKYLYWKAQALEKLGKDAAPIYRQIIEKEQDFYSVLARIKNNQVPGFRSQGLEVRANPQPPPTKPFPSERIDILLELGMKKEAVSELAAIARKAATPDELLSISMKLQDAGEYRLVITLVSRLPNREINHDILYPLAHWAVVKEASDRYGVDPFIVLSVMREESRFDSEARSAAGALGLMQMMPQTASAMDRNIKSRAQLYNVKTNIYLGSRYLNSLIKEFGSLPAAIAAYNAGEDAVRKWQNAGKYSSVDEFIEDIPYGETKNYVKRVLTTYFEYLKHSDKKEMPKIL
ncbi:MAG: soluble lytic murein transglycosylase [Nitrospirae bacterium]|nr:MAG: soluble lytic murein transglycosylase [Nitrospirota bacterium]